MTVAGIPFEFFLFVGVLVGVAVLHHHTMRVALAGLLVIATYEVAVDQFPLVEHLAKEGVGLLNLGGLLLGFAVLADHFELTGVPGWLPRVLPDDWKGGLALLVLVAVLSSFLDNIAAAMIGGSVAATVFKGRVHVGYLAAIVAASNAGGSGSVIGDTTTTMMWIDGVNPLQVLHAYGGAVVAVLVSGTIASVVQHRHQPILKDEVPGLEIDFGRLAVVGLVLVSAVATNVTVNVRFPEIADRFPFLAVAVWLALGVGGLFRKTSWHLLPEAFRGAVFLLSLVLCASMMPVSSLPAASPATTLGLGFLSSVFDNIPLTALALRQGGYDWGFLAYAVGYGGSMVWFGSSAGVALANEFPDAKSTVDWVRHGWPVILGYVAGFAVLVLVFGWSPHPPHR